MAVGNIYEADHVNSILMAGRADLVCLRAASGRPLLDAARRRGGLGDTLGDRLAAALPGRARPDAAAGRARAGSAPRMTGRDMSGRRVLITGGGSGIGRAVWRAGFAGAGRPGDHRRAADGAAAETDGGRGMVPAVWPT
jgi:hypothetical protein